MDRETFDGLTKKALAELKPSNTIFVGVRRNPNDRNTVSVRLQTRYARQVDENDLTSQIIQDSFHSTPGKVASSGYTPAYFQPGNPEDLARMFPFAKKAIDLVMSGKEGDYAFVGEINPTYKGKPLHVCSFDSLIPTKSQYENAEKRAKQNPETGEYVTHNGSLVFQRTLLKTTQERSTLENHGFVSDVNEAFMFEPTDTAETVEEYMAARAVAQSAELQESL